jgi:DNA-binding FadR family transcriptional regulator
MTLPFDLDLLVPLIDGVSHSALTPVRLPGAAEQIAQRLIAAISLGEFAPGERLPAVSRLAVLMCVNQTSIRDALKRLAADGYLEIRRGRRGGSFVTENWRVASAEAVLRGLPKEAKPVEHLVDLRGLLEPLIAATATQRCTHVDRVVIKGALSACAAADGSCASCCAANHALHTAIAKATHNPYLVGLDLALRSRVSLGFMTENCPEETQYASIVQHDKLVRAVLEGDAAAAAEVAAEHVLLNERAFRLVQDGIDLPETEPQLS